jgi:hypothetical protein
MAIRQLGKMNFSDLGLYVWKSSTDFAALQGFKDNFEQELASALWAPGIIYGVRSP